MTNVNPQTSPRPPDVWLAAEAGGDERLEKLLGLKEELMWWLGGIRGGELLGTVEVVEAAVDYTHSNIHRRQRSLDIDPSAGGPTSYAQESRPEHE
ncbi:hypothetical protein IPL85_02685 [Candidatus Saccharibacteria bacterium]|nr:MAG: hypothetical protein IPL85_02685 [Candidatus Saccharibacteria bacterium]